MRGDGRWIDWTTCQPCGKRRYQSKRAAKTAARAGHGKHLSAYRCPHGDGFHIGHLPGRVIHGDLDRTSHWAQKHVTGVRYIHLE